MKFRIIYLALVLIILSNCTKEEETIPPSVNTNANSNANQITQPPIPILSRPELKSINFSEGSPTAAICNTYSDDFGPFQIKRYGFCYSATVTVPTVNDSLLLLQNTLSSPSDFNAVIDGLNPLNEYYIRAFVEMDSQIIYSTSALRVTNLPVGAIRLKPISSPTDLNRREAISFSLNGKGYVGLGLGNADEVLHDLWEYDPVTDKWERKADYPMNRYAASVFVIDSKAYVCGGAFENAANGSVHCHVYDPLLDQWTRMLPMDEAVAGSVGFSIDDKGYIAGGITYDNPECLTNLWMYDPAVNTWSEKASLPIGQCAGTGAVINGKAYVGLGYDENSLFEYNPLLDSWKKLAEYNGLATGDLINFQSNEEIYFGFGFRRFSTNSGNAYEPTNDIFKYNLAEDKWYNILNLMEEDIPNFSEAITFQIEDRLFIGSGAVQVANNNLLPTNNFFEIIIE